MSAYEIFNATCNVIALCALAYLIWKMSESLLYCKDYLQDIAEHVNGKGDEPRQDSGDAEQDSND